MLATKEHYDLMAEFEKTFPHRRHDKEKDKSLWIINQIYEDGQTNCLFLAFRLGYALGKTTI